MMDFLIVDLPAKKTLMENADVVVELSFEAETSNSVMFILVATRKNEKIELDPGFTKVNGPMPKVRSFFKTLAGFILRTRTSKTM